MTKKLDKIDPNKIKVRDPLMVRIIQGVTKAGIKPDKKKAKSKAECRKPIKDD